MFKLAAILYSVVGPSLAGSAVVISLVAGYDTLVPILIASAAGFLVALPASYAVAKMITGAKQA
ncbi:CTP synthetase [Jannaschia sp. EhC01]|uniref:CTP synthetase n=1 Tax=Gymnodinialimonas phycosphaerae TaxID=2841589 RepID=A0A975YHM8_9RHOB|nr:CTP synthetase [Gymnodinialimonas phycosphaerae]MBY4893011.1 CTP synthetase [Gymnodinialimonas phycosphaerae]OAN82431.1 CTP synthetase [Jannaschia sp. EhC01]